jgi:integrase
MFVMGLKVHALRNVYGKMAVEVIDTDSALPHCFFLSTFLRTKYPVYNTMRTYAYQAAFYLRHFEAQGIDIVDRVEQGELFTTKEYEDYKHHCLFKAFALYPCTSSVVSLDHFSSKRLDNLIYEAHATQERVSASTLKLRLSAFCEYVYYLYTLFHFGNNAPESLSTRFQDFKYRIEKDCRSVKADNAVVLDPLEQAIPDDIYFRVLEIIQPWHSENPFSKSTRLRNQLIVQIFNETAIRLGALCKLKISDIRHDTDNPRILITRTPNDPTDPRKDLPAQKTKAHVSGLNPETMKRLLLYIETERSKYSAADTHDFVFVSAKGKTAGFPLARSSVQDTISFISKKVGFPLHVHLFRHKWNEVFEERAKALGYSHEQINDMRKFACGWSESSEMVKVYNEFKNAVQAIELSRIRQSEFLPNTSHLKESLNDKGES